MIKDHRIVAGVSRRALLSRVLPVGVGLSLSQSFPMARRGAPNFILILTDDLGYHDLSCFGATDIRTPNVDSIAARGVKFSDFYAAAPICTPSRAALLTGCYAQRVGLPRVLFPWDVTGISSAEVTIPSLLKKRGYRSACIGKWHLGEPPDFLPTRRGFDYFFGLPFSNFDKVPDYAPDAPVLMRNDAVIEARADRSRLTKQCTDEAIAFIEQHHRRPFFLYLAHPMPHVTLGARREFLDRSPRGLYGDVVEEVDWSVGEILNILRRHNLETDTLVIFTSDNGPWLNYGKDKKQGGIALPLRGGKFSSYEGGFRVPCVMQWPGRISAGRVSREVCSMIDFLPTFGRLAGAQLPTDRVIDGRDIWPLMSEQDGAKSPHDAFFYYNIDQLEAIRSGRWKLRQVKGQTELYDLESDISETRNLASEHPEMVSRLNRQMTEFDRELKAHSRPAGRKAKS